MSETPVPVVTAAAASMTSAAVGARKSRSDGCCPVLISGFFLTERLANRPDSDEERTFVIYMCAYAGDVLSGVLPGPYTEELARLYALNRLVPAELLERPDLDVARAAVALQIPDHELRAALPRGVIGRG